jgi:hypothetical protein
MVQIAYEDFELKLAMVEGRYLVSVERSPAGQAQGPFKWPFTLRELETLRNTVEMALMRTQGPTRRAVATAEMVKVQGFGKQLFRALMPDPIHACYESSLQQALSQQKGLRLKLQIDVPELADLPWELIYNADVRQFLALSTKTPLVRYLQLPYPAPPPTLSPPLAILVMVANPPGYDDLDVAGEKQRIQAALEGIVSSGRVRIDFLEMATLPTLQACLHQRSFHVLHFIGHGRYNEMEQEGGVVFETEDGGAQYVTGLRLGRLLGDHLSLRLVVLNACEAGRPSLTDPLAGGAAALVTAGVPAVVAMQFEITDRASAVFTRALYGALAESYPIDTALAEARKAIDVALGETLEWGTPVLYMRTPDGMLFQMPPSSEDLTALPPLAVELEETRVDQLFQTRGSIVDYHAPFYVPRAEERRTLQLIRNQSYVTIVGPRQTGKTSLLCQLEQQLSRSHFPVVINLADYYREEKNTWYEHLGQEIVFQLREWDVPPEPQEIGYPTDHIQFRQFLETIGEASNRVIVVMLDEVGAVPRELADDFFGAIRTVYDVRVRRPAYQKYVFVLAGATNPADLISRENPNSPFNVSEPIFISDLEREGTARLVRNLERIGLSVSDEICDRVHDYTGGHPNLTQKLCQWLVNLSPETLTVELVDRVADELIRSGDDNLRHLRKEVARAGRRARALLEKLLAGGQRRFDRTSPIVARLEVAGALKEDEDGFCAIRNEVYRRVLEVCLAAEDQLAEQVVDEEEVESLNRQLEIHKRNLIRLEERRAKYGIDAPPELLNRIEAEQNEIERLEGELSQLELAE